VQACKAVVLSLLEEGYPDGRSRLIYIMMDGAPTSGLYRPSWAAPSILGRTVRWRFLRPAFLAVDGAGHCGPHHPLPSRASSRVGAGSWAVTTFTAKKTQKPQLPLMNTAARYRCEMSR